MTVKAYEASDNVVVYDFETLSQEATKGVVVSLALLNFNEDRFLANPYTYEGLLAKTKMIKFDVKDQVDNYGRKVNRDTLNWWKKQSPEARKQLIPSKERDVPITKLYDWFVVNTMKSNIKKVYTRGNTFDPIFMTYLMIDINKPEPYPWWTIRDTRSMIDGMTYGSDISNKFIPDGLKEKFIAHDPRHDIVMDVMRLQVLAQSIEGYEPSNLDDEIPF